MSPARTFAAAAALALATLPAGAAPPPLPDGSDVRVERVRPRREPLPTLRFLHENRDFIRARFDRLRQRPAAGRGAAAVIDPRFLAYRALIEASRDAADSLAAAEEARARRELLASVRDLGTIESDLDRAERLLAEQRARLARLEEDFTRRQETALLVVASGYPRDSSVSSVSIAFDDGYRLALTLTPEQRGALARGGIVQLFHGFVEPREQVVEVALAGDRPVAADEGFVTLEPARDRLTVLRLDLSAVARDRPASSVRASTWLHDGGLSARGD